MLALRESCIHSPAGLPTSLGSLCVLTGFRWNHLQEPDSLPDRVPGLLFDENAAEWDL